MGASNVKGFQLYFSDPEASRLDLREGRDEILAATWEQYAGELGSLLSPADAEVMTGDLARWLTETHQVALTPGDQGWWDDGAAARATAAAWQEGSGALAASPLRSAPRGAWPLWERPSQVLGKVRAHLGVPSSDHQPHLRLERV
jgi:hypothetical protein